jgi:hypothetical protein
VTRRARAPDAQALGGHHPPEHPQETPDLEDLDQDDTRVRSDPKHRNGSYLFAWRRAIVASDLSANARLVAFVLSTHMNSTGGSCRPSKETMVAETSLSLNSVKRAIREVERSDFVTVLRHRGRRSNEYQAVSPTGPQRPRLTGSERARSRPNGATQAPRQGHTGQVNGATQAPEGVHKDVQEGDTYSHVAEEDDVHIKIETDTGRTFEGELIDTTDFTIRSSGGMRVNADDVNRIFEAWRDSVGATGRVKLIPKRRRVIEARLREGYPVPDLIDAVRGWPNDPWPERVNFTDITILLRDGAQVEKFRRLWQEGPPRVRVKPRGAQAIENVLGRDATDTAALLGFGNGTRPHTVNVDAIEEPR